MLNLTSTVNRASVTLAGASATLIAANPKRKWLIIVNNTAGDVYLNFAASAAATGEGIVLPTKTRLELDADLLYMGEIRAFGTGRVDTIEGTTE